MIAAALDWCKNMGGLFEIQRDPRGKPWKLNEILASAPRLVKNLGKF